MAWKNSETAYGFPARILHWLLALLIIGLLAFGIYLAEARIAIADLYLYGWHKALGILALALIALRLVIRFTNAAPSPPGPDNRQAIIARSVHRLLYLLMVLMPLSGWIASSASAFPMSFFGLFPIPAIAPQSELVEDLFFAIHGISGKLLIVALILHVLGALHRQFIKRDGTLRRMWF